jgi:uncharacterized repeat protein (TIGR01451 family)
VALTRSVRVQATDFSGSGIGADHLVAWPGDVVSFRLRASNAGGDDAAVQLTDALPDGLTYEPGSAWASAPPEPEWHPEARAVRWSGPVPGHGAVEVTLRARYVGPGAVTNAMWLDDGLGSHFAGWATVGAAVDRAYLPTAARP